jgi:CRP-like cAMP-binding protein
MNVALFGSIASLIAQWDERRAAFRLKLEAVEDFAERTAIAPQLVARIKRYYELVWERHNGVEDDLRVLEDLPRQLRTEVLESLYADKIRGVDIFRHAEQAFILSLATKLSNLVVPEGEWVVRKGEVGQEMFFIVRGECEVVLEGNKVVANLSRGSYFGEIALLLAERRTASIRTKKDCELLKLQKEDFEELLNLFPKTRELFYQIAQQRSKQRGVEDPEDALLAELPLVKRCPLFQHCEAEVARAVVFSLRPVEFARGDSVAVAGDAAHEMYFCSSGRLKVMPVEDASEGPSRDSWQKSVRILKEGDFFGQEALLEPGARCHASIVALEQATLMKLSRAAFMSVCSRFPDFAVRPGRPLDFSPSSPSRGPGQVRWNRLSPVLATVQKALSPHKKKKTG